MLSRGEGEAGRKGVKGLGRSRRRRRREQQSVKAGEASPPPCNLQEVHCLPSALAHTQGQLAMGEREDGRGVSLVKLDPPRPTQKKCVCHDLAPNTPCQKSLLKSTRATTRATFSSSLPTAASKQLTFSGFCEISY